MISKLTLLITCFSLISCFCENSVNNSEVEDTLDQNKPVYDIKRDHEVTGHVFIASVSPSEAEENVITEFKIEVDYEIIGSDSGKIAIGFNSKKENAFSLKTDTIVGNGSGTVIFTIKGSPVNYRPKARFLVYTSIFKLPGASEFFSFDNDEVEILVKDKSI